MTFQDLLDKTIDEPVPPTFDLDRVIAKARRSDRRHRLFTGAAAAALTIVVGGATWIASGDSGLPPPSAVSGEELDTAVLTVIEREVPDLRWLPGPGPAESWHSEWNAAAAEYHGRGAVSVDGRVGEIQVSIRRYDPGELPTSYNCDDIRPADQCAVSHSSYGLVPGSVYLRVHITRQYWEGSRWEVRETVYRSDGVFVDVRVDNSSGDGGFTGQEPPLLPDQVEDIATDSSLTPHT